MRKFYVEPEIELTNIRLLADVLGPSQDINVEEEDVSEYVETFNPDGNEDPI